tara:strand:- start:1041 stop:1442 length:402 start_codon:yes stop_codon:yes gene_type:complete
MKLESGKFCPLIGKDCIQLQCSWFTQVRGTHPQTGEQVDEWGCAVTWLPLLLMENTKEQISTTDTLADFRDETIKENRTMFTNVIENVMKMPILPVNVGAVAENSKEVLNMIEKRTQDNPTTLPKLAPLEDEL